MIEMTRGDTCALKFARLSLNNEIITEKASQIYFTVKPYIGATPFSFQKKLSDGTITFTDDGYYHFTIKPDDTYKLQYGSYDFDIEVKIGNYVKTIAKGKLKLTYEITERGDE